MNRTGAANNLVAFLAALLLAPVAALHAAEKPAQPPRTDTVADELVLNYHLMHPGGDSSPGDPNTK